MKRRKPCEAEAGIGQRALSRRMPRVTRSRKRQGLESPLETLEGGQPRRYSDFGLPASVSLRESISLVQVTTLVVICYSSPRKPMQTLNSCFHGSFLGIPICKEIRAVLPAPLAPSLSYHGNIRPAQSTV